LIRLDDLAYPVGIGQAAGDKFRTVPRSVEFDRAGAEDAVEQGLRHFHRTDTVDIDLRAFLAQQTLFVEYMAVRYYQSGRLVPQMPDQKNNDADANRDQQQGQNEDRKSTRLNSSHVKISYAVFCLKKK